MAEVESSRPLAGQRGRMTRRHQIEEAAAAHRAELEADGDGSASTWQQEVDSICTGTHPQLVAELEKHKAVMNAQIAQAERIRHHQQQNIKNLFECDKKQIEDEYIAQLEFFQSRLIDSLENKQRKSARQGGFGARREEDGKGQDKRRKVGPPTRLNESFLLKPDEMKHDMDEIMRNFDHYSVRSAAMASDDHRNENGDLWFDRGRQLLHFKGSSFSRGSSVIVYQQGQRVDEQWTITAMNAVEVTLRDADGAKLKVTLSQLRNGRCAFRPAQ